MVYIINAKTSKAQLQRIFKKLKSKKLFDAFKFAGAIKITEDALLIQKRMRSEWE